MKRASKKILAQSKVEVDTVPSLSRASRTVLQNNHRQRIPL